MTKREIELLKQKVVTEKQWLWMLINLKEDELGLPKYSSKQKEIDESLDRINEILTILKKVKDEKK